MRSSFLLNDLHNSLAESAFSARRVSVTVQDHADITVGYAKLFRELQTGNAMAVHQTDQLSRPIFGQFFSTPFLLWVES